MSVKRRQINPPKRIFTWKGDELIIMFNVTSATHPQFLTRQSPPLSWLKVSGSKIMFSDSCKGSVIGAERKDTEASMTQSSSPFSLSGGLRRSHAATMASSKSKSSNKVSAAFAANVAAGSLESPALSGIYENAEVVYISIGRTKAESTLNTFRTMGFTREDIYRMLDKGPWVLAFDVSKCLPKLQADLQSSFGLNQTQIVHIISHCPFLIAQYARFKGKDISATVSALYDAGYNRERLIYDIMRFPNMLSTPPDRIRGWMALLQGFGVATDPRLFSKVLQKAQFMYNTNPPPICVNGDQMLTGQNVMLHDVTDRDIEPTAYEAIRVLEVLKGLRLPDMDKLVRTCPEILLLPANEVLSRATFLYNLFLEYPTTSSTSSGADRKPLAGTPYNGKSSSVELFASSSLSSSSPHSSTTDALSSLSSSMLPSEGRLGSDEKLDSKVAAHRLLGSLLESSPGALAVDINQMRGAANVLRAAGLRRSEVVQLIRMRPTILGRNPTMLKDIISFLKYHCSLRKVDVAPFFFRCPQVLDGDVVDYQEKIDYLSHIGASSKMIRKFPKVLTSPLASHIRPRAEFLQAMKVDPLALGLPFLVNAPAAELAAVANMSEDILNKFCIAFTAMSKKAAEDRGKIEQLRNQNEQKQQQIEQQLKKNSRSSGARTRDLFSGNSFCEDIDTWF